MTADLRSATELPADAASAVALRSSQEWATLTSSRLDDGSRLESRTQNADGSVDLVLTRDVPEGIPGMFRRFLPKDGRVRQTESWAPDAAGGSHVTWAIDVTGAPGNVAGTGSLQPTATGSVLVLEGQARVAVPLIGGKAESYLVGLLEQIMAREGQLLADVLTSPT